jgi:UDP-4-amino-4,6-dideoxy-N-acetyl-beta-L-altrosamine transaminase
MTLPFLPYAHQSIDASDIAAVTKALSSDIITRGKEVETFEQGIANYCGAKFAVAFNSGSTALIAACHAANVGPSDRILTTPNTFVITAGAGTQLGATPVFIDIDRQTGNIDLSILEENLDYPSTRGKPVIVPVHFSGIAVDMKRLDTMIKNPDTIVIEDASHALGSSYPYGGPKVGSCEWSHMTVFSFHPAKTMTTGEGGMVLTNDQELQKRLRSFRDNGIERDSSQFVSSPALPWVYEVHEVTGNYNFTEFQAALGNSQLSKLDRFVEKRRSLVEAYRKKLAGFPHLKMFTSSQDSYTAFHLFVVQIDFSAYKTTKESLVKYLKENQVGTQVHYIPLYRHPHYQKMCGDIAEYFPQTEAYYSQALSLPLFFDMEIGDVERVVGLLKRFFRR